MKPLIYSLSRDDLRDVCQEQKIPAYRAAQIWDWLYTRRVPTWDAMTNLPRDLRAMLDERYAIRTVTAPEVAGREEGTRKLLVDLADGDCVETVMIVAQGRRTVCLSTQAGCKFGCVFCASGQAGFRRNLSAGEIISQVMLAADAFGDRPSHIVFMGIGEPLDNYEAVLKSIRILNDQEGLGIGARRITISTVGVVPGIRRLAEEELQIELSVSLHAPNDALRSRLLPVNRRYAIPELKTACAEYTDRTGRIITFEYTLIRDTNDARETAEELAALLSDFKCRVNLIRLNPIEEYAAAACPEGTVDMFMDALRRRGVNATYRESRGRSVDAACGQLRLRELRKAEA